MKKEPSFKQVKTATLREGKLFVGYEAEGNFRGVKTLFVKDSSVAVKTILKVAKDNNVMQIYLGAGNTRKLKLAVVSRLVRAIKEGRLGLLLTAEIQQEDISETTWLEGVRYILTLKGEVMPDIRIKFVDDKRPNKSILVYAIEARPAVTNFDDPLFEQDEKVL